MQLAKELVVQKSFRQLTATLDWMRRHCPAWCIILMIAT